MKRVLVRMPLDQNYFFPAVSFLHDYLRQLRTQMQMGMKKDNEAIVIEFWREDQFFFSPLFPRLELVPGDMERKLSRNEWSCVIDLRTPDRALAIAKTTGKHITDAWGILFGASPGAMPELGYMAVWSGQVKKQWDMLIDSQLKDVGKLTRYIEINYPEVTFAVRDVATMRGCELFEVLAATKLFIGNRSAATYLASMLRLGLVEYYPDDLPRTFLSQPGRPEYRVVFGECSAESIWPSLETVWETCFDMKSPAAMQMEELAFIAEIAVEK